MSARQRVGRSVALAGAAAYAVLLVTVPLVDRAFNALSAHPEDYASGSYGLVVNVSYLALGLALFGLTLALSPFRRWAIALPVLLLPAAILCVALAVDPIAVARGNPLWILPIFGLAVAPVIASFTLRDRFDGRHRASSAIAVVVLISFIGLVITPSPIGGIVNRVFDLTVALWVIWIAAVLPGNRAPTPA